MLDTSKQFSLMIICKLVGGDGSGGGGGGEKKETELRMYVLTDSKFESFSVGEKLLRKLANTYWIQVQHM